ncbi:hypothetical protein CSUNSWCD_246 [Campylobacter showae CSUNSWCD]|uniref:Uncharacterized protein n=1 Tax=Campylobacter showae CSUNSWCD TaxID=1244083 RepID=M5ISA3_9BACT|nr:hypothetical protein CSUNSWCD_246 [Campylobacter showae CSUNSWCD]
MTERALTSSKFRPNLILMIFKSTITSRSFYGFQAGKFGVFSICKSLVAFSAL